MDGIDVLVIRPPRFYKDGTTASIFPEEVLPSTILENNSISSRFLNADFVHFNRKLTLYHNLNDYILFKRRLRQFIKNDNLKWKYVEKNIQKFDPKIILLIMRMPNNFLVTLRTAKIAKEINPNIKVGVWRNNIEGYQRYISLKYLKDKVIDFVIIGEVEHTILEVSKNLLEGKEITKIKGLALRNKNNKVAFTRRREFEADINKFPIPNRDLVLNRNYYPPSSFGVIEGGRGCIYDCSFCLLSGIPFRLRSPKNVVEEMIQAYTKYGTREFNFLVTSFLHSRKWAREVCNLIKKSKLNIIFSCYANENQIDRKIIKVLRSAGCYSLGVGLESGEYNILKKMNKISNLEAFKKTKKIVEMIKSNEIFFKTGIIIGNPEESLEQIMTSLQFLKEIKPDFFRVQFLIPWFGTKFYEELKSKGKIIDENIDEYQTGEIKVKTNVDTKILKDIWIRYAKFSDLSASIILIKMFLNYRIFKCKIKEYVKYLTSIFS
jgi:radical SAM superfamily enzyme YgiQ (UPF0313 family)